MNTRSALAPLIAMALSGCDWLMQVAAEVRVEPEVQQGLSTWPQQVLLRHEALVRGDSPAAYRLAVLCEPSAGAFSVAWRYVLVNGCGEPSTIAAWIEPLDPAAAMPCGAVPREAQPLAHAVRAPPGSSSAAALVFAAGGRCPHRADVVLPLAAPPP